MTDHIDALQSHLTQVQGILAMITNAGADRDDFGPNTHATTMAALWGAQALIEKAGQVASGLARAS